MSTWNRLLDSEKQQPYFTKMMQQIDGLRTSGKVIYPPQQDVFSAFSLTPFEQTKVVILGQDPYHGPGQAHGLSFSVQHGVKVPPSLKNIYKELGNDIDDFILPTHGDLTFWARQGVLLLNTVLTVEQGKAHSHAKLGWETFTDSVVKHLNEDGEGIVFLLWGSHAQKKGAIIDRDKHTVLTAPHPSPLSAHRGFLGCKHFSSTNQALLKLGKSIIDWQV